jgi:hypothetical protein
MTRSRQTADWGSRAGLAKIVPTSITVGSGTGSVDSLGNVTFSGCSTVDISGAFSSTYDNYKIVYIGTAANGNDGLIRLGTGGVFNSTSGNYRYNFQYAVYTAGTIVGIGSGASGTNWLIGVADGYATSIEIYSPFAARNSAYTVQHARSDGGYITGGGTMTVTTSYDQIRFLQSSGNISGTIQIYGYTK